VARYGKEGFEYHGKPEGTAMTVDFRLNKMKFIALNGGPLFKFTEAVSIVIYCDTQEEIDHYWSKLTEGGEEQACGWLKDKFGVSWQITPSIFPRFMTDANIERRSRVEKVAFQMKKFDLDKLLQAYNG
jgi:predicted 3-demethylubiquinone-9 3-methyltransferase (glyoxalase superfamily)